jgi:hypothetical protein
VTSASPGTPGDQRLRLLLRWYPRAWRERYGEEFLTLVEDTLDGRRPGWRLCLGVAWAGLRERGHVLSGPAGKRALSRWGTFVMTGCLLAGALGNALAHPPATGAWQAVTAMIALAALAVVTSAAIVVAGAFARPSFVRFLRSGGWPQIRHRVTWAAGATAAATGALTWLVLLHASMMPGQQSRSQAYGAVFSATTLLIVAAIGLWASAGRAVKKHLDLAPRIRAAETLLAAVISTGVSTMVPVQIIWFGAIRSSTVWLDLGLALLAMTLFTAPRTLRRARRTARRQRAAAVPRR